MSELKRRDPLEVARSEIDLTTEIGAELLRTSTEVKNSFLESMGSIRRSLPLEVVDMAPEEGEPHHLDMRLHINLVCTNTGCAELRSILHEAVCRAIHKTIPDSHLTHYDVNFMVEIDPQVDQGMVKS